MIPGVTERALRIYDRLPEAYRDADAAQPIPAEVLEVTEAINLLTRPSLNTAEAIVGWAVTGGAKSLDNTSPHSGTASLRFDPGGTRQAIYLDPGPSGIPAQPGQPYSLSVWLEGPTPATTDVLLTTIPGGAVAGARAGVQLAAGWQRVTVTGVANGTAEKVYLVIYADSPISIDDVTIVAGPTPVDGNGDTAGWEWTGVPHASTSRRLPVEHDPAGYPLLRYLSLLLDQLDPLDQLVERIDYDVEEGSLTSDLVDGATANAAWFPWLAQLLGIDLTGLTVAEARAALTDPAQVWAHGTPGAIAAAAARGLTGTRAVTVTPHQGGAPFVIGIGTKDSETTAPDTWGELNAYAPTWAELHGLGGTFAKAAAPLVLAAVERERPAGYRFVRYSTGA